jgi:subtilase family serine protease
MKNYVLSLVVLLATAPVLAQQQAPMKNSVRTVVTNRQVRALGSLDESQTLKLSIALPLRNQAELTSLLQQLYNPSSPQYHHWLSVEQFTERFGPTQEDYDTLTRFALANGMTIRGKTANRFLLAVNASVAQVNKAFHVTMQNYQHPTESRTFYSPDRTPTLDVPLKIWYIAGLDNFSIPRSHLRFAKAGEPKTFTTGSGPGGAFLGSDMRAAYYGGTALTGAGQTIGLFGLDYNISDVENYFSNVGQPFNASVVQNYSTDGTTNSCSGCDDGEPVIDIVEALSMAPGVNAVIEYFGANFEDTFNAMATANVAKQLSASTGYLPANPTADEPIFQEFAAQGQNLFASSDDSGAYLNGVDAYYPADDPYVVSTGGTDLTTNGAGGAWQSESAWIGSGGGISTNGLAIPAYQQLSGVINSSNGGSTTLRNAPDVAMEANTDNWYCVNGNPCQGGVGGTSLSAPRWAGFLALVNEQAANNGQSSVGFLNNILYPLGISSNYSGDMHDITTGNNNDSGNGGYNAVAGYDLVTGWGSPNGQAFINQLAPPSTGNLNGSHIMAPASSPGLVLDDYLSGTGSGNQIDIWTADNTGAQIWVFSNTNVQPAGDYNIAVSYGAYCVTATGSTSGSLVNLQPCNGALSQSWNAVSAGSEYIFHPAANTGLCLDVQDSGTTNGTLVQVYTCNQTNAQNWALQ